MNILIADKFQEHGIEQLRTLGCNVQLNPSLSGDELAQAVQHTQCTILVVRSTKVPEAILKSGKELKLVIRAGSGYDNIDVEKATKLNIRVANCPGMNATAVAELTMGYILSLDRRICHNVMDLRKGIWNKKEYTKARGVKGTTLGIIGMGRIGILLARRAKAFEMNVIYHDVVVNTQAEKELGITHASFEEVLRVSDYVSLHVPGGSATRHLIGEEQFAMMKPTACILNASRGGVIDEQALIKAIQSGEIRGAGLDVYEDEPDANATEITNPIAGLDMVYGSHHIGASTEQAQLAVADETVRIIEAYVNRGEVPNCLNES